jgi:hypothetical protein
MEVVEPDFPTLHTCEGIPESQLPGPKRLHLRPLEHHAGLIRIQDLIFMPGFPIPPHDLTAVFSGTI